MNLSIKKKQGWWWILAILNHYIKFWLYHCIAIKIPSKPVVYVWVFSLSFPTISPPNFHSNHWKPVENSWKHHQTSAGLAHQFPTPSASSLATASIRPSWRLRFRRAWGWCQKEKYIQSFGRSRYFYIFLCMGKIWWSLMILWTSIYHQILSKVPPVSAHDGMFTHIILWGVFRRGSWSLAFCCLNLSFLRDGVIIVNHPPNIAGFWVFLALDLPHYLCSNSRWGVVLDIRVTFFSRGAPGFSQLGPFQRSVSTILRWVASHTGMKMVNSWLIMANKWWLMVTNGQ